MSVKISACTIAKNEEKNIARSIESYKDYVDEIIIVDTGSTDDTVKIAESLGAKVIRFEWINDFSAAKNCALEAAKGDWILFLDADEWIKDDGAKKLQSVINYAMQENFEAISLRMFNLSDDGNVLETNSSLRIFANKTNIRYTRKIHEHLIDLDKQLPLMSLKVDEISLNHSGYAESITKTKLKRNKELLEKNYMNGSLEAIDYFYLAREMVFENPEYSKQFLESLVNNEEKMKQAKKLDLANNIHELKIKLTKLLEGKYSFDEKLKVIDDAINTFPNDPMYYYYKYDLYLTKGEYECVDLLPKVIELDGKYENEIGGNNNAFARHRADVLYELGRLALIRGDNLKAMEYLVLSLQNGGKNPDLLKGLLYVINSQALNEKITFLNSIIDVSKQENLEFMVQSLRLSPYTDVFLYYFVKYYKDFGKVDISLFTSMMINKHYEEAAEKYINILINENDSRAESLISAALISGDLNDVYSKYKGYISGSYRRILNAYFTEDSIENISADDFDIAEKIILEMSNIDVESNLDKLKNVFNNDEKILKMIVKNYYSNRDYKKVIKEINKFIENDLSDEFGGEITGILGACHYALGDVNTAYLFLNQTVEIGFLTRNVAYLLKELNEKMKFSEEVITKINNYSYLLQKFVESVNYINYQKIDDRDSAKSSKNIEEFENEIFSSINLVDSVKNGMFNYANKLFDMKKFYLAEEYYKILLRCDYNVGKIYYKLGEIYNRTKAIELSYYCYKKAFSTAIEFPKEILPEKHGNRYYIYRNLEEKIDDKCPICGKKSELVSCYQYLEDANLSNMSILIQKYRRCGECNHIFADNYIDKQFSIKEEGKDADIFNAYDLSEKLSCDDKYVISDSSDVLFDILSNEYDVVKLASSFEQNRNVESIFEELSNYHDRKLIMVINDIDSYFEKMVDFPLWAKVDTFNAYSKDSIIKLLTLNGYSDIKVYNSKSLKGKIAVIAGR